MSGPVRHDAIEELLGAYALDAVENEERTLVEEHLAGCPRCRAEVAAHREVAGLLSHSGATAPEGLWERIAASLEEPPPPLRLHVLPAGAEARRETPGDAGPQAQDRRGRPGRRRRPRFPGVLAAAAAVVVLALIGTVAWLDGDEPPTLDQLADQALSEPDSQVVELVSAGGEAASARAVITADGQGSLLGEDLPALDGQIYQLWGVADDQAISLGDMGADPDVRSFSVGRGVELLAITVEDHAVDQSDHEPAFVGELS